jgi:hypothetical protein
MSGKGTIGVLNFLCAKFVAYEHRCLRIHERCELNDFELGQGLDENAAARPLCEYIPCSNLLVSDFSNDFSKQCVTRLSPSSRGRYSFRPKMTFLFLPTSSFRSKMKKQFPLFAQN